MIRRVAIFGPESTGKTRLAGALAAHFNAVCVPEYARQFWDERGAITLADIPHIAREQWRREDEAAARARGVLICDTESLTTVIWSELLYGSCPEDIRREAEERAGRYALYLLLHTDVPFAPDPQRCFPDPAGRERSMLIWRAALVSRGLPFVDIRGTWAQRDRAAIDAVDALQRARSRSSV
jgi:NadR type nicotinamide-nucleotide adenylyltransferase